MRARGERMARAHDADEAVAEQRLGAQLGTRRPLDDPGLEIDRPLAERRASLSGFGTKRSRTPGASAPTRAISSGPKFSTKPSLVRSVNVRTSRARSGSSAGRSTASASCTSWPTRSRSSSARGVGTRPRPARTSSGSPVVSRSRASARLIADGLSRSRRAARGDAALVEQHVEGDEQVEIGRATWPDVASRTWRQTHDSVQLVRLPPWRSCRPSVIAHGRHEGDRRHARAAPSARPGRSPGCRCRCCCPRSAPASPTSPCRRWRRRSRVVPQVQWVVLAYLLAITTLIVGAGRLGDLIGRRRLLVAGIAAVHRGVGPVRVAPSLLGARRRARGAGARRRAS